MKVHWTFPERLGALLIIKGVSAASLKEWKVIKDADKVLQLEEEEVKAYEKDKDVTTKKEFKIDEQFLKFLREKIKELDGKNMIPSALLPLAETLGVE